MKMYSVYDSALQTYTKPFYCKNKGEALRAWVDAVNDETIFGKHPDEVTLFEVGDFNEETGQVKAYEAYVSLGVGSEFVKKSKQSSSNQEKFALV